MSRTSVRPLHPMQAIELRAHRDKCSTCRQCKQRSECPQCQKCNLIFARLCFSNSRCARCHGCKKKADCRSKKLCSACQEVTPAISCQKCLNRVVGECVACKDCIACTDCLECLECLDEKDFTSCQSCCSHFDCDNCSDYKWANHYSVQLTGPQAGLKHIYDRAQEVTMNTLSLNDTAQRRFALLIGNSAYASTIYKALTNPVNTIEALAEQLKQPSVGFEVRILRNATKRVDRERSAEMDTNSPYRHRSSDLFLRPWLRAERRGVLCANCL